MVKNDAFWRAIATIVVWVMVAGSMALIGVFLAPELGSDALGALFMVLVAAVLTNGFIWNWGNSGKDNDEIEDREQAENEIFSLASDARYKRKRGQIGARLSDLSDTELIELRERIQSGELDDDELEYIIQSGR